MVDGRPLEMAIRAWPDDPAWAERTGALVEQSLPILSRSIGLPWVARRPFVVAEAVSQTGSAYAGRYDPEDATIEIAYYADELVTLHTRPPTPGSTARLLADRWANEGFATWYALDAAGKLGMKVSPSAVSPDQQAARIPLSAWGPVGRDEAATEDYGYTASAELARLIAARAGPDGLASVWQAARGASPPISRRPRGARGGDGRDDGRG